MKVRYYPDLSSGTPCGVPNGGGCTYGQKGTIYLAGTPYLGLRETFTHELLHWLIWCETGTHVDQWHQDPRWLTVPR